MTARDTDINGYMEVKANPISKVGVFPYRGASIDASGALGLDPEGVYFVYRSAAELSDPETIESFKLIPWINDHTMLGDGFSPTDSEKIEGVIGEDVYFEDGYLLGNLKLFGEEHAARLDDGKNELSCGYRCSYELKEGTFGDQKYSLVQKNIRGNHLASIDEGRMGPEVSVLDQKLTFAVDAKDFHAMPKTAKTLQEFATDGVETEDVPVALQLIMSKLCAMDAKDEDKETGEDQEEEETAEDETGDSPPIDDDSTGNDEDEDKETGEDRYDEDEGNKGEDQDEDKDKDKSTMDAMDSQIRGLKKDLNLQKRTGMKSVMREIRKRDEIVRKVSPVVGVFDHAEMTSDEVARYACKKIGIKAPKGQEVTAIDAYLLNRRAPQLFGGTGMDAASSPTPKSGGIYAKYFGN